MRRIFLGLVFTAFVLSVYGLFLPWGKEYYVPVYAAGHGYVYGIGHGYIYGIELLLGTQLIAGCVAAAVSSFLYVVREKRYYLVPALIGGLFAVYSTVAWVSSPRTDAWHWGWVEGYGFTLISEHVGFIRCTADYGAYLSLVGSVVVSVAVVIWLLLEAFFKKTS